MNLTHGLSDKEYSLEDAYGWVLDGIEKYVEDNLDDFLEHFGTKGMHWGVRKSEGTKTPLIGLGPDKIERVTKSGDKITLTKNPPTAIHKGLSRISSKYTEAYNKGAFFTVTDKHGKEVGEANIYHKKNDELYINWIGVKSSARGNGYGSAIMKAAEDFGSKSGMKKMTLEVPGNSPDARHIYESMGFKVVKEGANPKEPVWGGLTSMEYTFDTAKHYAEVGEDFLAHYGKMGMHWGVRNRSDDNTRDGNTRENTLRDHTPRTGMSKKKKVVIGVGVVLAVAGIVAVGVVLKKNGISPVSAIKNTVQGARKMSAGKDLATSLVKQQGSIVLKKAGEKVMDKTTEKVATKLSDKFDEKMENRAQGNAALRNSVPDPRIR